MADTLLFRQLSSLAKVFLDDDPNRCPEVDSITALKGERISWQILYKGTFHGQRKTPVTFTFQRDDRIPLQFYTVGNVPCMLPCRFDKHDDDNYLRTSPGLYPDVLFPLKENRLFVVAENCHSLFITATIPEAIEPGSYPIRLTFTVGGENPVILEKVYTITVLDAVLPPQETVYTQWFHSDCIATYYGLEILSEAHWAMLEKFIAMAAHTGINMLLTPIFTPPLDTAIGSERPTMQLMDIRLDEKGYHFSFDKLARWIRLCQKHGIHRFEICHLFTQWGSGCTPKIVVHTKDGEQKLFGWHVKSDTPAYQDFLNACIPALTAFLKEQGVYDNTYFHISDEPKFEKNLDIYLQQRQMIAHLIPEDKLMEACSHPGFMTQGIIKRPVCITNKVETFWEQGLTNIWAYYCCLPHDRNYGNRFIAMPSGRNRINGFQLYKYGIGGFLHWGYNFYYSQLSRRPINPFCETDAEEAFPSGDAFSVYPGAEGPLESLRSVVFYESLQDIRACQLLERHIGREAVLALINQDGEIKFNVYPSTDEGILAIRQRINDRLAQNLK